MKVLVFAASRRFQPAAAFVLSRTGGSGALPSCHLITQQQQQQQQQQQPAQDSRRYFQSRPKPSSSRNSLSIFQVIRQQQGKKDSSASSPRQTRSTTLANEKKKTKKKKNYNKKSTTTKPKKLFRAERVLANRSGKTRAECHKLFKRYAISILEEQDEEEKEDDTTTTTAEHEDDDEDDDEKKLRIISAKEQIPMNARIFINKKIEVPSLPPLLMIFHKPKWMLSTMNDPQPRERESGRGGKPRNNLQNLSFAFKKQMHPVGRLDYDSSGLLLFSSSGQLTQHLLHPKFEKEKEYIAIVSGIVDEEQLKQRLQMGVELADIQTRGGRNKRKDQNSMVSGEDRPPEDSSSEDTSEGEEEEKETDDEEQEAEEESSATATTTTTTKRPTFMTRADLLEVRHIPSEDVAPYLSNVRNTLPEEYNVTDLNLRGYMKVFDSDALSEIRLVVTEGKHRMVRRLLASCGHTVVDLKRERIGMIPLGDLPVGSFRNTTLEEEAWAEGLLVKNKNNKKKK